MNRVIVIPHIKVMNANALSSPVTVGFPAMTSILGCIHALQRKLANIAGFEDVCFSRVGVANHSFTLKAYKDGGMYLGSLIGMGIPLNKKGERSSFIEEARCDLEITLVVEVKNITPVINDELPSRVFELMQKGMRIAGGDIMQLGKPKLLVLDDDSSLATLKRLLMPGYVLIERRSLMKEAMNEGLDGIDALLSFQKVYFNSSETEPFVWESGRKTAGWIVPIATGYQAISDEIVSSFQRDHSTKHFFAESIVTLGEFVMPHRLRSVDDMLWSYTYDSEQTMYMCINEKIYKGV